MRCLSIVFSLFFLCLAFTVKSDTYHQEANHFLKRLPPDSQHHMIIAIQKARSMENGELQAIRNARNVSRFLSEDILISDITPWLSLYSPVSGTSQKRPLLIYFHGGGWTIGSINSCSQFCMELAKVGDCLVLAVNYRLAPEYPYPAGLEDCVRAVEYAMEHVEEWGGAKDLISLGGDSSGGNLAIAAALRVQKNKGFSVHSLILFYPVLKAWADNSESWHLFGKGFGLDADLMSEFNHAYTADVKNPEVSFACASDEELKRLPPILFIGADRDILRDQGKDFVERLTKLKIPVFYHLLAGTVHLFITVPGQNLAFQAAVKLSADFLNTSCRTETCRFQQ